MPFANRDGDREIDYRDEEQWLRRQEQIRSDIEEVGATCALQRWRDRLIAEGRLLKQRRPIVILIPQLLCNALTLPTQEVVMQTDNSLTTSTGILLTPPLM